jgi:hypothetical protein
VDGGVDGGGDGCELTRWGRVGVGAGKGRGVAAAKSVKEPFVVVDGDVTGHMAGVSGQRSRTTCPSLIQYCSVGGRW